jgi:hypothetical protein
MENHNLHLLHFAFILRIFSFCGTLEDVHLSLPWSIRESPAFALVISAKGVDVVNNVGVETPILLRFFGESPTLALVISAKAPEGGNLAKSARKTHLNGLNDMHKKIR